MALRKPLVLIGGDLAEMPGADTLAGNVGLPFFRPPVGQYFGTCPLPNTTLATVAGAAGRMDIYPFRAPRDIAVDFCGINVSTAVASALAKVVIYDSDDDESPTVPIATQTGDMDCSTTGAKTAALALTMRSGKTYWIGVRSSSTATLSAWQVNIMVPIWGGSVGANHRNILRRTVTYANPAPSPWVYNSAEGVNAAAPAVWLRRSS